MSYDFIDHTTDPAEFDRVTAAAGADTPAFVVRTAPKDLVKLASVAFADPANGLFPIHDKSAAWLSTASFLRQTACGHVHPESSKVMDKLSRAMVIYDFSEAEKVAMFAAAETADASLAPPESFTVNVGERAFAVPEVDGAGELAKIAAWMYGHAAEIPFEVRHEAAKSILVEADAHKFDLGEVRARLEKSAGLVEYTAKEATAAYRSRLVKWGRPDAYYDTRHSTFDEGSLDFGADCAHIESMDKSAGLVKLYAEGLPLPEDLMCPGKPVEKVASAELQDGISEDVVRARAFDIAAGVFPNEKTANDVVDAVRNAGPEKVAAIRAIINS